MALRPKIVRLAKMIGGISGMANKIDENAPEYYSLECVVSDELADVALAMGLRKERTAEYVAKKLGKPLAETQEMLNELAGIGVCSFRPGVDGKEKYIVPVFAPGVLEMMVGNREQLAKYPQIAKAFEEYTRLRMGTMSPVLPMGHSLMRVIPVEAAIDANPQAVPYERLSYYLSKYNKFSISDCSCRATRRILGQGCGHLEHDICIQVGVGAEFFIRTGRARQVTREEVLELLKKAEENGLVHEIPNLEGMGETTGICNCCSCSCFGLRVAAMFGATDAVRSNYVSTVDKEKCVACGQCVESCPTNALKLGQKLCTKSPVTVPEVKKVTEHRWTEADWNIDYRENRRDVLDSGTAPCKTACPAHIAVQGYIKLAAQGKYTDALELIKKENPFPAVCGRICPRNCESECTRGDIDAPIAIDEIKKFIADQELNRDTRFVPKKRHEYGKKIAIIGSGPAGLSCAYYLAIDGYAVTVFEKQLRLGGMLTLGIPSFRLEKNVVDAEIEVLKELGVEFRTGVDVGSDVTLGELREQGYKGFYLAIGAQAGRRLGIEGEDAEGVITGVDFLREVNLGGGERLNGKTVVIGGGNVAIDVARTAVRQGAEAVGMYCLESTAEMPALPEETEEAKSENIMIFNGWGPKRIITEGGRVRGVEFKKCVSVFDESGRFSPKYDENALMTVDADFVLVSVGQSIDWGKLLYGSKVELGRGSAAVADSLTYQTKEPDIFVGGDVYTGPRFAIDAIAAGKEGAVSLHRFVQPGQSLVLGRDRRIYHALDKENLDRDTIVSGFDNTPRQRAGHNSGNDNSFRDARVTFTEEQLKKETERCLGCGATSVDEYLCLGCGLCTTKCKFDAVKLVKKYNVFAGEFEKMPVEVAKYALKRSAKIAATAAAETFSKK